ncbi:hypothetical protein [Sabulibacter ruber]|uniref:HD domain-containing protein n=1 Tax=Sabulibacter ruber TaxID=2811901 RepID=UPI001A96A859|nr:hypothetical protein [Sabulibacter ruber]
MEQYLWQTWQRTAAGYSVNQNLLSRLWEELEAAYSSRSRHYHNLRHIEALLRLTDEFEANLTAPALVRFAIFYHDAVYSSSRSDNEEKSAQLASKRLPELGVPQAEVALVEEMILATKSHRSNPNPDTDFLLDFDLAILGAPWDLYHQYSQQIRKEYSLYPDFLYHSGRKKVLRHFLDQESIFKTPPFQAKLESQARQNLAKELQGVSAP